MNQNPQADREHIQMPDGSFGTYDVKSLLNITRLYYKEYGRSTIENRALADYRDGLKPVHRRIMWGIGPKNLNLTPGGGFKKAARVVGDVMGKFHPHGDSSIYNAMVGLAQEVPVPLLNGEGNWGNLTDNAAAMRYTEVKASKYGWDTMFSPNYLATILPTLIENYDGEEREPIFLPAILPNLLINGAYGIATGISGIIPPIYLECLLPFIESHIEGKTIGNKRLKKHIKFNHTYGGINASTDEQMDQFLQEGYGTLRFEPKAHLNHDTRTIIVYEVPPMCNWETVVSRLSDKKGVAEFVSSFDDMADSKDKSRGSRTVRFEVKLKNSVSRDDFTTVANKVLDQFITMGYNSAMNWTHRQSVDTVDLVRGNLANLIGLWTDYRVDLEVRTQAHIIKEIDTELHRQTILKMAADNVEVIARIIKTSQDPVPALVAKFKISEADANVILDLTLRRLTRLNREKIEHTMRQLDVDRKIAIKHKANPGPKVMTDLNNGLKFALPKV